MKKFFTTLAAMAMVIGSANAAINVTYKGAPVENGAEIVLTNDDFHYTEYPHINFYQYEAEVSPVVESGNPVKIYSVANAMETQTCPGGTCLPSVEQDGKWIVDKIVEESDWDCVCHFIVNAKHLSDAHLTLDITLTDDDDEPFTLHIVANTTDSSAVETVVAGNQEVVAIYDLQGRKVAADYRGAAIVVYADGKAAKTIR